MGWCYYRPQGRIDRLTECRNVFGREPDWATIVKDALVDDIYYAAMRSTKTNKVWALIVITDVADGEFGYKDMDETMGPFYYDCPNTILKLLSPTDNEYAKTWREKCYANTNKRKPAKPQKDPLDELRKYLNYEFSSGPYTGEDYKTFQNKYINYLRRLCRENGWELVNVGRNHYCFSCFIKSADEKYIYLSIDDVRGFRPEWYERVLIRIADHEKDYRGRGNNYTSLEDLQDNVTRLLRCA